MKTIDFKSIKTKVNNEVENRLLKNGLKTVNNMDFINNYIKKDKGTNLEIVENLDLSYLKFEDIDFKDIKFKNCSFENSIFINCKATKLNIMDSDLKRVIFKSFNINNINIEDSSLKKGIFINCNINYIRIKDCDLKSFKLVETHICSFEFDDSLVTKFNEDTFFDNENFTYNENSYRFYKDIAYKFQQNNLLNHYGEYFYIYKNIERKNLKGFDRYKSRLLCMICGYGERPTYALITSLEIIFIFTFLYMGFGLSLGDEVISYKNLFMLDKPITVIINDFIRAFHFSIVTFTTVGYGDITPIGYSILLSGVEMFLGVTMVGIWTATLARKINR